MWITLRGRTHESSRSAGVFKANHIIGHNSRWQMETLGASQLGKWICNHCKIISFLHIWRQLNRVCVSAHYQMMIRDSVAVFVFLNSALLDYLSLSQLKVFLCSLCLTCSFVFLFETHFGQMSTVNITKRKCCTAVNSLLRWIPIRGTVVGGVGEL